MSKSLDQMRVEFQHWKDHDRKLHEPSGFRKDEAWMAWQHQQEKIDALDGKTVLPVEIEPNMIREEPFGLIVRGLYGGFDARLGKMMSPMRDTPAAAIDSLAEEIRKGKP